MKSEDHVPAFGWSRAAQAGLTFRRVSAADEPFLFRLYASTRTEELAPVPWSDEQKAAFLEMQARAQHADYQRNYADADWLVIERGGADIGRLYLDRGNSSDSRHHIIDIAFLPEWRGKGLGGALLRDLLDEVGRSGKAMSIHVEKFNPAMRLYRRLGFETSEDLGVYDFMQWTPRVTAA
jgi:ribosomal protein S18 acetylase RimI-like enzyme